MVRIVEIKKVVPISECERHIYSLYGPKASSYIKNLGPDAKILYLTDKPIPENHININIAASAADDVGQTDLKEAPEKVKEQTIKLGKSLSGYFRRSDKRSTE